MLLVHAGPDTRLQQFTPSLNNTSFAPGFTARWAEAMENTSQSAAFWDSAAAVFPAPNFCNNDVDIRDNVSADSVPPWYSSSPGETPASWYGYWSSLISSQLGNASVLI